MFWCVDVWRRGYYVVLASWLSPVVMSLVTMCRQPILLFDDQPSTNSRRRVSIRVDVMNAAAVFLYLA